MTIRRSWATFGAALVLTLAAATPPAAADPIADFYRGKTVNLLIGVPAGGEYDLLGRLVARYLGRHIPGNPTIVTQNVVGASGLKMAHFMYSQAPQDGTTIGIVQNTLLAAQAAGLEGIAFDAAKFNWLGAIAPAVETMAVWHTTGVKSVDDARKREVIAGATSRGAITFAYPQLMNEFLGTRFKIVTGYAGGNPINLAMERGEVEARNNTWSSWKSTKAAWLKERRITVIAQAGPRAADLDAPSIEALARTPEERQVIELVVSGTQLGRPFTITPGVPPERVKALRTSFMAVMTDPDFRAEALKTNIEVAPIDGERLQTIAERIVSAPPDIRRWAKRFLE
jgi:tripartite-type tricarboxylate transporter receptor subunit TctC